MSLPHIRVFGSAGRKVSRPTYPSHRRRYFEAATERRAREHL